MITVLYLALVFFLVFANGFFVASEFALVGVRRSRIEMLAQSGNSGAKRLLGRLDARTFRLIDFTRPPAFIPETVSAGEALKQIQSTRVHFVFVVNEHGGVEGILTLEDLLEEIVGEIDDEFDDETKSQIKRDRESYVLDGMLAVRAANQQLGLSLPERDGYTTIAGFLLTRAGRMLNVGDEIEHESGTFRVEKVDGRRILRVRFHPREKETYAVHALIPLFSAVGSSLM
jgi:magnesium and cobalt exporter, CNNM family